VSDADKVANIGAVVVFFLVLAFSAGTAWFSASQEAAAYKRVTGIEVSTWDALFLELRVDGSGK
jgi:hypothetical protein